MPRTRKPPADDPGAFARALLTARHKAGKNVSACARDCGLSRTFLTMIELGKRCPELERVAEIAYAYGITPSTLAWLWVTQYAPSAVPALASRGTLEDSPVLQNYYRQQYLDQQVEPFKNVGYVQTGPRGDQQQAPAAPEPVTETDPKPRRSR